MVAAVDLTRRQVVAYRVAMQGLVERANDLAELAVLDVGVQDTPPGSLRLALSARLVEPLDPQADLTAGGTLTAVWSHRGAPHLHHTAELPAIAAACWPRDDADAAARLGWQRARLAAVGMAARTAYREVAAAVAEVLDRPLTKGALSSAVTGRIAPELAPYCRPCGTHHVAEQLLRLAALPAGARLQPGSKPVVLEPMPGWPGPPADAAAGSGAVQAGYLRLHPPASAADVAGFLGTSRAAARPDRAADLVPVRVEGRPAELPAGMLAAVDDAEPTDVVRLLPPSDPLLQARDREVLVPDAAHRKRIWPTLGPPGVVLVGVDVAGTWRTRQRGTTLEVTIDAFRRLSAAERSAAATEAERVAVARGATEVKVGTAGGR